MTPVTDENFIGQSGPAGTLDFAATEDAEPLPEGRHAVVFSTLAEGVKGKKAKKGKKQGR